ncbi:hypothetical protein [Streptomyces malaysiensis]
MARIQILELPEGAGDQRPPFALVIDQARVEDFYPSVEGKSVWQVFQGRVATADPLQDIAEQVGARAVLIFEDTIDIPANDTLPSSKQWELTVDGRPATWTPVKG